MRKMRLCWKISVPQQHVFFHDLRKRRAVLAQEGHPCVACPEKIPNTCFRRFFGRPHIVSGPGIGETILGEAPLHITTDCGPDLAVPLNMAQRALSDPKVKNCGERNHIVREQHNMTWCWVFFPPLSRTSALHTDAAFQNAHGVVSPAGWLVAVWWVGAVAKRNE